MSGASTNVALGGSGDGAADNKREDNKYEDGEIHYVHPCLNVLHLTVT